MSPQNRKAKTKHATANPSCAPKASAKENTDIATRNLGLICGRCIYYHRRLPGSVKTFYDVEDMISEIVMHVWRVREKYDSTKARESTWLRHVTDNRCRSILSSYSEKNPITGEWEVRKKFNTSVLSDEVVNYLPVPYRGELHEAKSAVERVIEFGSDSVIDFLDKVFNGGLITEVPAYELRQTAKRCGARLKDFELVYRLATGA